VKKFVKQMTIGVLCLFGMTFVACRGGDTYPSPTIEDAAYSPIIEETDYAPIVEETNYTPIIEDIEYSPFVEDIDFLIYTLENNLPLFNAGERALGVNMRELIANVREAAVNGEISSGNAFQTALTDSFGHFNNGYANFGLLETLGGINVRFHVAHRQRNLWTQVLDNPGTRSFYRLEGILFDTTPAEAIQGRVIMTESIKEGRIALITPPEVFNNLHIDAHTEEILDFAHSIVGYEHLIIDIRHLAGWEMEWFPLVIMQNLISQPLSYNHNFFSMGGEYTRQFYSLLPRGEAGFSPVTDELLAQFPYLHPDDIGLLRYHYNMEDTIHPSDRAVGFDGKIWLLVSPVNIYAASYVANLVQETGFATLVGEPTGGGGITSIFSVPLVLPNTGMVVRFMPLYGVDHLGRNTWEHPTQPDILNHEGMDAMQTVLELIEEGSY